MQLILRCHNVDGNPVASAKRIADYRLHQLEFAMESSRQRTMIRDLGESAPALIFVVLWQAGSGIQFAGWTASAAAALVLAIFWLRKIEPDPICLGINLHVLLITPIIVGAIAAGYQDFGRSLAAFAYPAVLATMFVTSLVWIVSGRSVVGKSAGTGGWAGGNLILLSLMAAGGIWAANYDGAPLLKVALPVMGIFLARRYMLARRQDRTGPHALLVSGLASGGPTEPAV